MKRIRSLALALLAAAALSACDRAYANQQTLFTSDCGVSWRLIEAGNTVPAQVGRCSYKVTVPNYPLQGGTEFKTSFKDRVLARVELSYEYEIIDALAFVKEARYLGRANTEGTDETNSANAYESAENAVIDRRLREAAGTMLRNEDIVDFSQADFEDRLTDEVNKHLASKGVKLSYISFVPMPEEQTRLAIDILTAMKVYESRGLTDLGQQITVARSGATKVEVTTPAPAPVQPEEK